MLATTTYLGLGSNLGDPLQQLRQAVAALAQLPASQLGAKSAVYRSPALLAPENPKPQPDYLNAVVALHTQLPPQTLLQALQAIEAAQGRRRDGTRWQARPLDLDMLLYGDLQWQTAELCLPHPGLRERAFVLYPLYDCNPQLRLPGDQLTVAELRTRCTPAGLHRVTEL